MRYFLDISYNGKNYHGWQEQPNAISVQEVLDQALTTILRTDIRGVGSGRTDTGVHAFQQVVHIDTLEEVDIDHTRYRLNSLLPHDIAINSMKKVKAEAHARFDAMKRSYRYFLHTSKNPFKNETSYFFPHALCLEKINEACKLLISWKDFQAFSKVHTDVNNYECDLSEVEWETVSEGFVFKVSANRFLRGMVRTLVGTLLDVGLEKLSLSDINKILESRDRRAAGRSVPAHGLYLSEVQYSPDIYL